MAEAHDYLLLTDGSATFEFVQGAVLIFCEACRHPVAACPAAVVATEGPGHR